MPSSLTPVPPSPPCLPRPCRRVATATGAPGPRSISTTDKQVWTKRRVACPTCTRFTRHVALATAASALPLPRLAAHWPGPAWSVDKPRPDTVATPTSSPFEAPGPASRSALALAAPRTPLWPLVVVASASTHRSPDQPLDHLAERAYKMGVGSCPEPPSRQPRFHQR
jgi:hypothetical protein